MHITQHSGFTEVAFLPDEAAPGSYDLFFESYDDNSSVKSTLKLDLITVEIVGNFLRDSEPPSSVEVDKG